VHQAIQAGLIDLQHIEGRKLTADAQTKAVPQTLFEEHTKNAQIDEDTLQDETPLLLMSEEFDITDWVSPDGTVDDFFAALTLNRTPILSPRSLALRSP